MIHLQKNTNKVKEISNEILRWEQWIRKNYNFVDNVIIPQLNAINSTYKLQQKKYNKMKKLLEEYINDEKHYQEYWDRFPISLESNENLFESSDDELNQTYQQQKQKLDQIIIVSY